MCLVTQSCPSLCNPMDCSPLASSVHGDFPGKGTRGGCYAVFQGLFPTQGLNPGLHHCRWIIYQLSHQGSPRILEWIAFPFSSRYSQPRNRTRVSCIAGGFFTSWATREVCLFKYVMLTTDRIFKLRQLMGQVNFISATVMYIYNDIHPQCCKT